ncbi:extracellular solute-binding protein [Paenibacillus alkalitolerans]|uniref:extracellular solute-binding protein n=1 Tax=Paenibacillus alkalitolerans TaxID=2799335 RepID=UPI0018F43222|nr:extracellular solute-binding protein [Paenibacillus alkalitolerans]
MKKALITAMALFMVFISACGTSGSDAGNSEEPKEAPSSEAGQESEAPANIDPYGPVAEKVTITIGKAVAADPKLPEGSTVEDNEYTRFIEDKLNVDFKHAWQATGDAYAQKVSLSVTSGDIPDVMVVSKSELTQLVRSDLVEDLTQAYETYASDNLKGAYESTNGYALRSATYDGKLMAMPNVSPGADGVNLLWVRQDWLDALGLQPPKSLDDVLAIAKAFKEQDPDKNGKADTFGLLGSQNIVNLGNSTFGFDTVFSLFDSYPELWYEKDGEIVYGSVQPETKEALAKLSEMYKSGLIDQEFGVKNTDMAVEHVVSGKSGIFFGPWWLPFWPLNDAVSQDPKAEWKAYLAPLNDEGVMNTHVMAPTVQYLVVKKGFKSPEAVVKTLNYQFDMDQTQGEQFYQGMDVPFGWTNMPFTLLLSRFDDKESKTLKVQSVIDGKADVSTLEGEAKQIYESYIKDKENPKKDLGAWSQANAFMTGVKPLTEDNIYRQYGAFYDQTETMTKRWANLQKLEDEAFLQIILGTRSIDYFDEFVAKWKEQGGDKITEEVREAAKE